MPEANFLYKTPPRQHQIDAVHKLYGMEAFALLMEQGTGKTWVSIVMASNLYKEGKIEAALLIAPNNVHTQWSDEQLPEHSPVAYEDFVWQNRHSQVYKRELQLFTDRPNPGALKWFCVNVDAFSRGTNLKIFRNFVRRFKTMVIVDEATRIKNPEAKRTLNIIQGLSDLTMQGKRIVSILPLSKYRVILTGTIVTNSPFNVWAPFEFLRTNFFGRDFFAFKARYGIEVRMQLPGRAYDIRRKITSEEIKSVRRYAAQGKDAESIARIMKISESSAQFLINNPSVNAPYKNLEELKQKIDTISFTVRKADCLDLPPKIYEKVIAEASAEQKRVYKELQKELLATLNGSELSVINKMTLIGRLQQITGGFFPGENGDGEKTMAEFSPSPKMEALIDDLEECVDRPVIVVAHFVKEIEAIRDRLRKEYDGERIETIYGAIDVHKRNTIRESFNRGEVGFLVANSATIGMGFNLQVCHTMYFYSNSYSFDERAQVEDRIHRDGQKSETVLYKDVIMKDTVDERILDVLKMKKDLLDYMRDKSIGQFIGGEG